jgi:hypothetical protein
VSAGKGPILTSNAATVADYNLIFPAALPAANRFVCLDASGNLSACTASAAAEAIVAASSVAANSLSSATSIVAGTTVTAVGGIGVATTTGGSTQVATTTANNTTTPSNVTGLSFTGLTPAATYGIWCDLLVTSAATTTGVEVGLDLDDFTSASIECSTWQDNGTPAWTRSNLSTDDGRCINTFSSGTGSSAYLFAGTFTLGAAGTSATVRVRSEVGASSVSVLSGSRCTVVKP